MYLVWFLQVKNINILLIKKDRDHITKPLPMIISKTSAYVKGQNEFTVFH